jgi:hypothetical protein
MRPSVSFDWARVITPLRWAARVIGAAYAVLFLTVSSGFGNPVTRQTTWQALFGVIVVGLLLAISLKGIGEIAGGVTLIGGAVGLMLTYGGPEWGALAGVAPFILAGLLFIACGWHKIARETPSLSA